MKKSNCLRMGILVGLIVLFIGISVIQSHRSIAIEKHSSPDEAFSSVNVNLNGDILYVGGSGPGNFTNIQDAVGNASNGDTVFVYDDSSPYYENVVVDKSINVIGENKDTTVIDASGKKDVIFISGNGVTITGFTLQNSGSNYGHPDVGVEVRSDYNTISGNTVRNNLIGIWLYDASDNIVSENTVTNNNREGIFINEYTYNNFISGNTITNNNYDGIALVGFHNNYNHNISRNIITTTRYGSGIYLAGTSENIISGNTIINNTYNGICLGGPSHNNTISWNTIKNHNLEGIFLSSSSNNSIFCNNFINNKYSAYFRMCYYNNKWSRNYWDRPRLLPKPIIGTRRIVINEDLFLDIPWVNFDWHPAQEPYDIPPIGV